MSSLKILAAAIAAATFSVAYAQGTPPRPATNPAVGAGQRSTQNTPMGTTGTPGSGGAMAQGTMGASGAAAATAGSSTAAMGTETMTTGSGRTHHQVVHRKHRKHKHVRKADRN